MELKALFADEDAVSPVIGVILMVAITVILAAVIGTFVLGLGDQVQDTAPQASFSFDYEETADTADDSLTITHDGGAELASNQITVRLTGMDTDSNDESVTGTNKTGASPTPSWSSTPIAAGSSITIDEKSDVTLASGNSWAGTSTYLQLNEAEARITWEAAGGGSTATIGEWSGPDA